MRVYELMFILHPDLDEEGREAFVSGLHTVLTENGGEILDSDDMGRRRLAYPIRHRIEGHYHLMHARMDNTTIAEVERYLRLSEAVMRYLLLQVEARLEPAGQAPESEA